MAVALLNTRVGITAPGGRGWSQTTDVKKEVK
jgi:hypothetical protein